MQEWAKRSDLNSIKENAGSFKAHGVNGKCLLHIDRHDLQDIGVDHIADLKQALVQIRQLAKIPKKVTMDLHIDKNFSSGVSPAGKHPHPPGQVSFAGELYQF